MQDNWFRSGKGALGLGRRLEVLMGFPGTVMT